ncbi:hypothetical protein SGLAM104S_03009 [Streptomyces glaucescens]
MPSVPSMRAGASPNSAARPRTASWMGRFTGGTSAYSLRNIGSSSRGGGCQYDLGRPRVWWET